MGRHEKQLIYGGAHILVALLALGGTYWFFLKPAPSCTNGIKDGDEQGIDCGGTCPAMCLPSGMKPLAVEDATVFHPAPDAISVLAKIRNPNPNLAARDFSYRFDFYDDAKKVIYTATGRSFAYASEIEYLTAYAVLPEAAQIVRADVQLGSPAWVLGNAYPRLKMALQDRRVASASDGIRITGRLVHRDTVTAPSVRIVALFFGGFKKLLGISETELDDVSAGESRPFTIVHPPIPGVDLARTEIAIFAQRP